MFARFIHAKHRIDLDAEGLVARNNNCVADQAHQVMGYHAFIPCSAWLQQCR